MRPSLRPEGEAAAGLVQLKDADAQHRPLLQRRPQRAVQPVFEVELAVPADHVREQVTVERRVGGQDGMQVQNALRGDELVQPDRTRRYFCPFPRGPGVIGIRPPFPDPPEYHTPSLGERRDHGLD